MRLLVLLCLFIAPVAQADLFKCVDSAGKVTYTNMPCARMGLTETKVIPPPPAPTQKPKNAAAPSQTSDTATTAEVKPAKKAKKQQDKSVKVMQPAESNDKRCTKLKNEMGKIMDEMDAARRQGYTAKQETAWDNKLRKLQAEKNRLGCF